MPNFRVSDDQTSEALERLLPSSPRIHSTANPGLLQEAPAVIMAPAKTDGQAFVITIRHRPEPVPTNEFVLPEENVVASAPMQAQDVSSEHRENFVASGFLGLYDATLDEDEERKKKMPWWKRMFID